MAVTDKIYVKNHRRIASQLETNVPRSAFSGATLDLLFDAENLAELDGSTRERVLDFATDFLDCACEANPHCGHPEEKFVAYLLELRESGLDPERMVDVMTDDYMVYAYPGDILSFLDDAVRTLEATEDLAAVEGNDRMARLAREKRERILQAS